MGQRTIAGLAEDRWRTRPSRRSVAIVTHEPALARRLAAQYDHFNMSVLYTFPGQGAQCAGMLHALPDDPEVRRTIEEAGAVLGFAPLTLDNAQALRSTVAVQLSLLIAGVATARVLFALGHEADMVAGLSIGAYPAAVVAGALDSADAVRLLALRGRLMEQGYVPGYGMTAIVGPRERL